MIDKSKSPVVNLVAIALGVAILIGTASSWLSFRAFTRTPLLMISALFIVIAAFLNMMLVWSLYRNFRGQSPWLSQLILIFGILGSGIVFIGATFDFLNTTVQRDLINWFPLSQTQSIIVVGYAFLGIWLLLLNFHALLRNAWSTGLPWLGIISGLIMAIGLFALPRVFIPYVSLYHQLVPELGELVGNFGWMIVYPIWSIWFGCVAMKAQSKGQQLRGFA